MDVAILAPVVLSYFVRYLPKMIEAGKFVGGKALEKITENLTDEGWKFVQPWIGKLMGKIEENPGAKSVVEKVALAPDNQKYQNALEVHLEDILAADPALAGDILRLLAQAEAAGKRIAADRGGVVLGDNAQGNVINAGHIGGDLIGRDKN